MGHHLHKPQHDYHLVDPSPWPLVASFSVFLVALGGIFFMNGHRGNSLFTLPADSAKNVGWAVLGLGIAATLYTMYGWWRDVVKEAQYGGFHTRVVQLSHRYGMLLFIASEIMFFVAWFWAFFDASLFPKDEVQYSRFAFTGGHWPPKGVEVMDPWDLPLFNTLLLLTSGTSITWAHHALLENDRKGLKQGLLLTIALGAVFSYVQVYEYYHAPFAFKNTIYGATFFMATGFHGFHVVVGTIFLAVCLFRSMKGHFTPQHHLGFEFAAWYWHFVDVVWLFLFCSIYIWGGQGAPIASH